MAGKKRESPEFERLNAKRIGFVFGVSHQAVGQWYHKGGCPRNDDHTYDLREVVKWRLASLKAPAAGGEDGKEAPKDRLLEEQVKMAELNRLAKESELLPREDVRSFLANLSKTVRAAGGRLRKQCEPKAYAILKQALGSIEREIERAFGDD